MNLNSLVQPIWFGSYILTARIATGGMAEVFIGHKVTEQRELGARVAIKRLLPHHIKSQEIIRMFLNEARITAQIHHPNVVRIYELGQVENEPFIAMELLEGKSFDELRLKTAEEGRRLPLPLAMHILTQACRGLDAAHRAVDEAGQPLALVHRDFTPDNIHVGFDGDVKVIDFGIARTGTWGNGTEPGILKGKFFYMSPEMVLGRAVDNRADLFAAGVMLYEQLCGRRPFSGLNVEEVLDRIGRSALKPPSAYDPSVPPRLAAVAMQALQPDPDDRYPSLAEFIAAIEAELGPPPFMPPDAVRSFLESEFPPFVDARRRAFRQAQEIDRLLPALIRSGRELTPEVLANMAKSSSQSAMNLHALEVAAPGPALEITWRRLRARLRSQLGQPLHRARERLASFGPLSARARRAALAAGLCAAVLALGGAYVAIAGRRAPAPTLMEQAATATDGPARAGALLDLVRAGDATPELRARGGALAQQSGDWETALAYAERWAREEPEAVEPRLLAGRAAMHLRQRSRAEEDIAAAARLAPESPLPDALLAEVRESRGDLAGALEAWGQARRRRQDEASYSLNIGRLQAELGALDDAEATLEAVLRGGPNPDASASLGFVKFRKKRLDEAAKLLNAAVAAKPDAWLPRFYRAAVLYAQGDIAKAREEYREADRLAQDDPRPLQYLCQLEAQQKTPEVEELKKTIAARFPKQAQALLAQCVP